MYIVTFYSFRGGVGRTTALLNVGLDLARRARKVLMVDFDLESPDLTSFAPLSRPKPQPGIVEYAAAYRETGESPDVTEYLYPLETDGQEGRLWVMPAGRADPAYWEALAGIDWQALYDRQEGYLFFEDARAQWEQLGADYVLIDTHAGITPALGIGTRQLADAVVMMFNPHQRDTAGLDEVSRHIQDEAEQTGKSIAQFFVASGVVEADEELFRFEFENKTGPSNWIRSIRESEYENSAGIFEFVGSIPFSHQLLLGKGVAKDHIGNRPARAEPGAGTSLARAYHRVSNALIKANFAQDQEGARVVLCEIHARPGRASGVGRGVEQEAVFEKLERIIHGFQSVPEIQAQAACCLLAGGRDDRALQCMDQAIELEPESPPLLWQRASYRSRLGWKQQAEEDLLRLVEAGTRPRKPLSVEALLETLKLRVRQGKRPRFALPKGFEEEQPAGLVALPDYSDSLIHDSHMDPYVASALRKLGKMPNPHEEPNYDSLGRSQQWAELVDLLRPTVEESKFYTLKEAILLFLAYWGLGSEQELLASGKRATERFQQLLMLTGPEVEVRDPPHLQIMALVFWKIGEAEYARGILDVIDEVVTWPEGHRVFSYWHFDLVVWERFKEDCNRIRNMFKGETISPPFLGKEPVIR